MPGLSVDDLIQQTIDALKTFRRTGNDLFISPPTESRWLMRNGSKE